MVEYCRIQANKHVNQFEHDTGLEKVEELREAKEQYAKTQDVLWLNIVLGLEQWCIDETERLIPPKKWDHEEQWRLDQNINKLRGWDEEG